MTSNTLEIFRFKNVSQIIPKKILWTFSIQEYQLVIFVGSKYYI